MVCAVRVENGEMTFCDSLFENRMNGIAGCDHTVNLQINGVGLEGVPNVDSQDRGLGRIRDSEEE
jgi:hypothetical protein